MPAVQNVLVVGGGVAGTATAILLAEHGVAVRLIEQKAEVSTVGSGITLQGNALRVLRDVGVWPEIEAHGYGFMSTGLRAPDPAGSLIVEIPDALTGGPDLPATLGLPRPDLARILIERAASVGVEVSFGTTLSAFEQHDDAVEVTFGDGATGRFDLVIGADGLHSRVRELMGIDVVPRALDMAIWRVFTPRPESVTRTDLFYGGPAYIAGYCPTGEDSLYAYIVEPDDPSYARLSASEKVARMRRLSEGYHGPWDDIRPLITEDRGVNFTTFETHVVDGSWGRGRVVIIGDAAHSCPPTLAQGAAQSLEDAAVLAELLLAADQLTPAVWDDLQERRLDRARDVVEASVQLGQWLIDHNRDADVAGLMRRISTRVAVPA